ncbi:hypothetical protein BSZ35_04405 [Salinibacter sp. 10B]|uniref:hypothetical protein n=1 Tax=Salinibacter sp. 10B TaxID=1923971 RepID=UPI000CF4B6A3|nr:hypothetical protein [Salinibacter sp. 10B]PQJ33950.1 hypothetical protein BSZ35_04405 [Salinibacter sp. 10B]
MASDASSETTSSSSFSFRKWGLAAVLLAFFSYLLWFVINPYRNQPYVEYPHGDHVHYAPKDRNENVPISRFPTRPPEPGERITPEGEIVPEGQ